MTSFNASTSSGLNRKRASSFSGRRDQDLGFLDQQLVRDGELEATVEFRYSRPERKKHLLQGMFDLNCK